MSSNTHNCTANRAGPTTSGPIEDNFVQEIQRRFRRLRGLIRQTVGYQNNALELKQEDETPLLSNAEPRERFEFATNPERIKAFMDWVEQAIQDEILEPLGVGESPENSWIAPFIRGAYLNGWNQATGLLFQQGASVDNPSNDEILSRPISQTALQTLYTRTYENLQGITEDMSQSIRTELTEGFARGDHPRKMASRLTEEIRDLQHNRAETLARTGTINAHTTSQIDRYEQAGVTVVVHSWDAANDERTCPFCERLDGVRLSTEEMRNGSVSWAIEPDWKPQNWRLQPPAHPNCRCSIRAIPGASMPETDLSERVGEEFEDPEERVEVIQ